MSCLLCQSKTKNYFNYGKFIKQPYGLTRCLDCGLVQTEPLPSDEFLADWYQQYDILGKREPYYQGLASQDPWKTSEGLEVAVRFVWVKKEVASCQLKDIRCLDVGSGLGLFLDLVKRAGWKETGIELNCEAAKISSERFGVLVRQGTFESVGLPRESFEIITFWDIFEHVRDPLHMLERAHALLKPGGLLFIETPNVSSMLDWVVVFLARIGLRVPAKTFYGLHHLTLWNPKNIRRALEETGFTVKEIKFARTNPRRIFRGPGFYDWLRRLGVSIIEWIGKLTKRENKMIVIAQKSG